MDAVVASLRGSLAARARRPNLAAGLVGLTAFAFFLALWPHASARLDPLTGDEPYYVMTAISLVEHRSLDESNLYTAVVITRDSGSFVQYEFDERLNPPDPLPPDWKGWERPPRLVAAHAATTDRPGLYTKHGIGLSALIALPWMVAGRFGANMVVLAMAALLATQMFLLARESGARSWLAATVALGLTVSMPVGPYALLLFPEIPAALLLIYAIRRVAAADNRWWQWLLTGTAIGFLPWLHQRFAPTAVVMSAFLLTNLVQRRGLPAMALALTPVAVGGMSLLAYNQWLYGQPLQSTEDHAGFSGLSGTINGGFGLLLDAQWGLLIGAPVMLLALAAIPRWLNERRRMATVALAALAPYTLIVAAYSVWWGEWGPPARYLVPVVPLAAGPLGAWLATAASPGKLLAFALWIGGMLLAAAGYQDPQRFYHHPDGINHLATHLGDQFAVDLQRYLVAFQIYSAAPFASRFWISAGFLSLLVLATIAISGGALRVIARDAIGTLREPNWLR